MRVAAGRSLEGGAAVDLAASSDGRAAVEGGIPAAPVPTDGSLKGRAGVALGGVSAARVPAVPDWLVAAPVELAAVPDAGPDDARC